MAEEQEWGLVQSFYMDTDGYSDRDRVMFCAGYEFQTLLRQLRDEREYSTTIHRENESRVRMAAAKNGRTVAIQQCEPEHDPDGTWSYLKINAD